MENQQKQPEKPSIFRRKALDRISSPEELDQYLTVTGPGVWLPLIAVIVLLIGAIVWMIFGRINVTMNVAVISDTSRVVCYVPYANKDSVLKSGSVTVGDTAYPVSDAGYATDIVDSEMDTSILMAGSLSMGQLITALVVDAPLPEGIYCGEVTVETINPISYIIN